MHTIKSIDKAVIKNSLNTGLLVSLEEHNTMGSMRSAISEMISDLGWKTKLLSLGNKDSCIKSRTYKYLLTKNRLTQEKIIEVNLKEYA